MFYLKIQIRSEKNIGSTGVNSMDTLFTQQCAKHKIKPHIILRLTGSKTEIKVAGAVGGITIANEFMLSSASDISDAFILLASSRISRYNVISFKY